MFLASKPRSVRFANRIHPLVVTLAAIDLSPHGQRSRNRHHQEARRLRLLHGANPKRLEHAGHRRGDRGQR